MVNNSLVLLFNDGRRYRANFHLAEQTTKDNVTAFLISSFLRYVKAP